MYDKMPCGNTQAEIDRDINEDHLKTTMDKLLLKMRSEFVIKLMSNEIYCLKRYSGGQHFNQEYTLNDAVSSIDKNSDLWNFSFDDIGNGLCPIGELYDSDPDCVLQYISLGFLPTNLEKIVKSAVESLADEVFGE